MILLLLLFVDYYYLSPWQRFHDCLHLADVIAAEKHLLYKVFRKAELQDFLQKLRTSALTLLEQDGVDAFGYPVWLRRRGGGGEEEEEDDDEEEEEEEEEEDDFVRSRSSLKSTDVLDY